MSTHEHAAMPQESNAWRRFWERGGWWRSLLLVAGYFALYQLSSLLFGPLVAGSQPGSPMAIVVGFALPIALGSLILVAFGWSTGWLRELFARQPIRGRGWMWIAVAVVLLFNVLHFAAIDYGTAGPGVVAAWLFAGLFIGFAEEVLTRGFVVNLMRKAGYREISVALISSLLFAAMHSGNLLTGQALFPTLVQIVYTFAFGLCMYLALRVTGNLIWPILLHATTDPSIFLFLGHPTDGALAKFANMGNPAVIITGLILLIFIRGRVQRDPMGGPQPQHVAA